ncbi:relaxase/mobilization nuclease domain-containing protein [Clostridium butyricum]|uniref:relaxase/mobilization nuclease domain-containing protein n=1 Tax=Clostridium butyricum TaxID=1492 RepID=UPI0034656BBE
MAIVKAINSKSSVSHIINYVADKDKTNEELMSGKDCSSNSDQAIEDMKTTKALYNKEDGRQYKHFVQSFSPDDDLTPQKAHAIGKEWAEKNFKGYEVFIATHTDKDHLHNHFVINSVNFETGEKYRQSTKDLSRYKEISDKICEREGLAKTPSNSKDITTFNNKKYRAMEQALKGKGKSYLIEIGQTVEKNIYKSTSKEDFIRNMERDGYNVKWEDTRKHITFVDQENEKHKARAENLANTFKEEQFNKEQMLKQFEKNKEQTLENKEPTKELLNKKADNNDTQELQFEINRLEAERNRLLELKAKLEKAYKESSDKFKEYDYKLDMNKDNTMKIEDLTRAVKHEKETKDNLKGFFKGKERKQCDEKIEKYENKIQELKGKLLDPQELKELKEKHSNLKDEVGRNQQGLSDCRMKLEINQYDIMEKENNLSDKTNNIDKVDPVEQMFAKDEKALKAYKEMKSKGEFEAKAPRLDKTKDFGMER